MLKTKSMIQAASCSAIALFSLTGCEQKYKVSVLDSPQAALEIAAPMMVVPEPLPPSDDSPGFTDSSGSTGASGNNAPPAGTSTNGTSGVTGASGTSGTTATTATTSASGTSGATGSSGSKLVSTMETFALTSNSSASHKVDLLFVVDNSISMANNQAALAAAFSSFATTYLTRTDLDICLAVTTSDRNLGRTKKSFGNTYQRDRYIGCQSDYASTNNLIAKFTGADGVLVGDNGSSSELLGRSLATFLHDTDTWTNQIGVTASVNPFFRKGSIPVITMITDEDNASDDLPAVGTTSSPGIKNHLDAAFSTINGVASYAYSVMSILKKPGNPAGTSCGNGCAQNIFDLVGAVGNGSKVANIDATSYNDLYAGIGEAILNRIHTVTLGHKIYEADLPVIHYLKVAILRADGKTQNLRYLVDYDLSLPSGITIRDSVANTYKADDRLSVTYAYEK